MAHEPLNMATGINTDPVNKDPEGSENLRLLWGLQHLLIAGMARRFYFNRRRYNEAIPSPDTAQSLGTIRDIVDELRQEITVYRQTRPNTAELDETIFEASQLVMRQHIHDVFYRLHHEMLELPADQIEHLIPHIDQQLLIWKWDEEDESARSPEIAESNADALFDQIDVVIGQ